MLYQQLHQLLIPKYGSTYGRVSSQHWSVWFALSLTVGFLYSFVSLHTLLSNPYAIQDDGRQHVFWMWRLLDPTLFPQDLIADYFQSVAPNGYVAVYKIAAWIGIHPILLSKLLPIGLGVIAVAYCFGVCYHVLPIPLAGFIGSVLFIQNVWIYDDLASGVARAFLYPIFMGFLYYVLTRSLFPCLITVILAGLFYPQAVLTMGGILLLQLVCWDRGLKWRGDRFTLWFVGISLITAILVLLPYLFEQSTYGPVVTVEQAKTMLEFGHGGRNQFFIDGLRGYWLMGKRTGLYRHVMPLSFLGVIVLPILCKKPQLFPLVKRTKNLFLLVQIAAVSLGLFFVAHVLLFKLYLPSRYAQNSWQIIASIAGGVTTVIVLDALLSWMERRAPKSANGRSLTTVGLLILALFVIPHTLYELPKNSYTVGTEIPIYQFLAQQPKTSLISGVSSEADNIPTLTGRAVLTSREYALPYHIGYYNTMRQRSTDLLAAQYSDDPQIVKQFINQYGINYWLVQHEFESTPEPSEKDPTTLWLKQYEPTFSQVKQQLAAGKQPILLSWQTACSVIATEHHRLLDAQCLLSQ